MSARKCCGALVYSTEMNRFDIRFDIDDYYGGLHCGQCLDVMMRTPLKKCNLTADDGA